MHGIFADAGSGRRNALKYKFMPVETYQTMEFVERHNEEDFKQPNIIGMSDDEEVLMAFITETNLDHERIYSRYELQADIKSDSEQPTVDVKLMPTGGGSAPPQNKEKVMPWLMKHCGLNDESLKKLEA